MFSAPLGRIGGAIPTVFSYFAEVLAREKRGEHLSWLCMFWMIGGIYASAMAWAIIPHYGKGLAVFQLLSPSASALPRALAWGQHCPCQVSATHNAQEVFLSMGRSV